MEKLLAAVAQTHGFDDDAPVQPAATMENLGGENGGSQSFAGVHPIVIVHNPPPDAVHKRRKQKRIRPAVVQPVASQTPPPSPPPPPPPQKRTKQEVDEEEDVCFICLDGGSLVLCDRKGCPKAYHPACIKRDEAFFSMKAKWTCGWHICTVCQKGSCYMCYTCTYSLCKGCIEDSDFSCVRGEKGFCSTCMKMIMLIENKGQAGNVSVQVDFDDKMSWEYLLKVYWVILKEKMSLTMSELVKARKSSKGAVDCLEAEISQLNNRWVRANENGNQNELREYVDKFQILPSAEEHQQRIDEAPDIHSDIRVSPHFKDKRNQVNSRKGSSAGTKSKRDENMRPSIIGRPSKGLKSASPNKKERQTTCSTYESKEDLKNRVNSSKKGYSVGTKSKRGRPRKGQKSASPNKKVVSNEERRTTRSQSRLMVAADGSNNSESDKQVNQVSNNGSGSIGANHAVQRSGLETMVPTDSAA